MIHSSQIGKEWSFLRNGSSKLSDYIYSYEIQPVAFNKESLSERERIYGCVCAF